MAHNELWKPQPGDIPDRKPWVKPKKQKKQNKNKRKRDKSIQERKVIRDDLLKHFELNQYATNIAICFCIHKKTGLPLPGNDRQSGRMLNDYWKSLKGDKWTKRRMMTMEDFYGSKKWRELRYIALQQSGGTCTLCGATAKDGVQLHVDHIIPRSRNPKLQYNLDNLQILCSDCNLGKSNYDDTDFR